MAIELRFDLDNPDYPGKVRLKIRKVVFDHDGKFLGKSALSWKDGSWVRYDDFSLPAECLITFDAMDGFGFPVKKDKMPGGD